MFAVFVQTHERQYFRMETGKRALFAPLVPIVGLASSGCLGYCIPCRWSARCCYANEDISKLRVAAVACQVYVCVLFTVWCHRVTGRPELLTPNVAPINNLWNDTVSNGISQSQCCVAFPTSHLPSWLFLLLAPTSLFISPSLPLFGTVY